MGVRFPDGWMESAPAGFPLPPLIPPGPPPRCRCAARGGGRLTSVGFYHRGINAWAEGRQGEVGRGILPFQESFFSSFPAL
jgi:hypothetical protein